MHSLNSIHVIEIYSFARTVVFDRAGLGLSKDLGPQPRSAEKGSKINNILTAIYIT